MLGEKRKGGSNAGKKSSPKLKRGLKNKLQRAGKIDKVLDGACRRFRWPSAHLGGLVPIQVA